MGLFLDWKLQTDIYCAHKGKKACSNEQQKAAVYIEF